jgi:hypothetical protein
MVNRKDMRSVFGKTSNYIKYTLSILTTEVKKNNILLILINFITYFSINVRIIFLLIFFIYI